MESPANAGSEQYHWIKLFVHFRKTVGTEYERVNGFPEFSNVSWLLCDV